MATNLFNDTNGPEEAEFTDLKSPVGDLLNKPTLPFSAPAPDRQYFGGAFGQHYIEDRIGHELKENARVWRVYNDEALLFDRNMVYVHRETIDILLVFAGLFSAVVITILVEVTARLEPDHTEFNTRLLIELINQGAANGVPPLPTQSFALPNADFRPEIGDVFTCGLWFASLVLSLFVSLFCVVIKQWLSSYLSPISSSLIGKATTRQLRYESLHKWKVPFIIGLLPQLLTISVLLFFIGLVIYLFSLNEFIAYAIAALAGFTVLVYLVSATIPVFLISCPYKTSLTSLLYRVRILFSRTRSDMGQVEVEMVNEESKARETRAQCLFWLCDNTQMPAVTDLVMESLSALYVEPIEGEEQKKWELTDDHREYERILYKRLRNRNLFAVELMDYIEAWWWSLPWDESEDLEDALDKEKIERVTRSALYLIQGGDYWKEEYVRLKQPVKHSSWPLRGVNMPLVEERTTREDEFEGFFRDKVLPTFVLWADSFGEDIELEKKLADMDRRLDPSREQRVRRMIEAEENKTRLDVMRRKLEEQELEEEAQVKERIRSGTTTASIASSSYITPTTRSFEHISEDRSLTPPITIVHAPSSDSSNTTTPLIPTLTVNRHWTEQDRAPSPSSPHAYSLTIPSRRVPIYRTTSRRSDPGSGFVFTPKGRHDDIERNFERS